MTPPDTDEVDLTTIGYTREGHVGWLRLDRPSKLNAMTATMWAELASLGGRLRDDPMLRALVVVGNGRAFSAGIDLSSFGDGVDRPGLADAAASGADRERGVASLQEAFLWLRQAWYPSIAAVRGHALGAGLQLALACDLRVAAAGTRLGMLETDYGLVPDLGGTQLLPRLVGPAKAKELIFTAAVVDAAEALRIGLVNQVVADADLESTVADLAATLAGRPPIAMRWSKRAVDASDHLPLGEGLRLEQQAQAECLGSHDFTEAISAMVERRPARFTGT